VSLRRCGRDGLDQEQGVVTMLELHPRLVGRCAFLIGEAEITPAAPHLFALLLVLSLEPSERWTRRGVQELLFDDASETHASHRLRQLLYRLRSTGVQLTESADGLLRIVNPVTDLHQGEAPSGEPRGPGVVLPQYAPRLPAPFLDWLERRRTSLQRSVLARQAAELRAARERQDWATAAQLAAELQRHDLLSEELAIAGAEARAMLGERDAAVDFIDHFVRESDGPLSTYPQLRKLRARILAAPVLHRQGTLRGRQECLVFLADQWTMATRGSGGRASAVFGPPGMGKSRVGEAFAASIRLAGGDMLSYRCDAQHRHFPLVLFSQVIRDLRSKRGSLGADPDLRVALDDMAPDGRDVRAMSGDFEARREDLRRAIVDLLEAVSAERPVLLMIDDAHLLDDASRSVVRWIAESGNRAKVLVVLLCRPRPDDHTLVSPSRRFSTYTLPALGEADSRALLLELSAPHALSATQVEWAVGHAGGNAFYLHALAHHPCDGISLPAHVRSLAQTSYLALSPDARTVLDVSLLLDTLASPARVARASALDDRTLMSALRELEESDLLRFEGGLLAGPHAIVREALVELIPSAASAVMHRRIAQLLTDECTDPTQARSVAWAAVSSWLTAGESAAAVTLALRIARMASAMGEPEAGAVLLSQVPREGLSVERQREVLDEIIALSVEGKCPLLQQSALKKRKDLAERSAEDQDSIADFTIRILVSEGYRSKDANVSTLKHIATDASNSDWIRSEARLRLLAASDLWYDADLAKDSFVRELPTRDTDVRSRSSNVRANLIYHSTFGELATALAIIEELLALHPAPRDTQSITVRSYAILGLLRIGHHARAAALAEEEWVRMHRLGQLYFAEYFGGIAIDSLFSLGRFDSGSAIADQMQADFKKRLSSEAIHPTIYYSSVAIVEMRRGAFLAAARLLDQGREHHQDMLMHRYRSADLALSARLRRLMGIDIRKDISEIEELFELFRAGSRYGAQDIIAEELWFHLKLRGEHDSASLLLDEYLTNRREEGLLDQSLREATRLEPVWLRSVEKTETMVVDRDWRAFD
jgi:DNA-binding SARP family transcriptional activator